MGSPSSRVPRSGFVTAPVLDDDGRTDHVIEGASELHVTFDDETRVPASVVGFDPAYWSGRPYLGLGPSAHSFDGQRRWANASSLTKWAEAFAIGADPRAFVERLDPSQRALETLYLGLRTADGVGVDHPLLGSINVKPVVAELVAEGLCRLSADRLACTERGFLVYDAILDRLVGIARPPESTPAATTVN